MTAKLLYSYLAIYYLKARRKKSIKTRVLRAIGKILIGLVILFVIVILFIRSKWGQDIIVNNAVSYVSKKTNTKVEIDKLFITFGGNIMLNGLYLEDTKGDTLVYSKSLEANMPLWPIIKGEGIGVDYLDWKGLTLNIVRNDTIEGYNFQFLLDAFATKDTVSLKQDTLATPLDIIIGTIHLNTFDVTFNDVVLGIDSRFVIGHLSLTMDKIDIAKMDFRASEINLSDASIKLSQRPVTPSEEAAVLPFLSVGDLALNNVITDYNSIGDDSHYHVNIGYLNTEIPKIDLSNKVIEILNWELNDSKIAVITSISSNNVLENDKDSVKIKQPFKWPDFKINFHNIDLNNNTLSYINNKAIVKKEIFNSDAIVLNNFSLKGTDIFLLDKKAGLNIENLSFKEASGNHLKRFALDANLSDKTMVFNSMNLLLNDNILQGNLKLEYGSFTSLIDTPENTTLSLNMPTIQFDVKDIYQFQPELRKNELLHSLSKNVISGNMEAAGTLASINIPKVNLKWGNETELSLKGSIKNATNINNLQFNIPQFYAQTNKQSLSSFVNEDSLGINLPELVAIKGLVKGSLKDLDAKVELNSSQGKINLNGHFNKENKLVFDTAIKIDNYDIGTLLNNNKLGNLTLSLTSSGKGKSVNDLNAELLANIEKFGLNDYEVKNLTIHGDFKEGKGNITSNYKDENVNLNLLANVVLDSVATEASVNLNIIGADLQALGLTESNIRTGFKLNTNFKGNSEKFNVNGTIENGVAVYDSKTYLLGGLTLEAFVDKDTTSATIKNKILNFELHSNAKPEKFSQSLQRHIASYFYRDIKTPDSLKNPVNLELKGKITQAPLLNEVLLVKLRALDTIDISINFKEKSRKLSANITAPHINYSGSEIDSLVFSMDTDMNKFVFDLGFKEINSGPLSIKKTSIEGNQRDNQLDLRFISFYENEELINIQSNITGNRDSLRFHILHDNLILNKNKWEIPTSNEVLITENHLFFNDFNFKRNGESLSITDKVSNAQEDRIDIDFNNFKLNKIINYLNPDEELATGILKGEFSLINPFEKLGIIADLSINQLNLLNVDLGTLNLDANSNENNSYDFLVSLKEGQIDLDLTGDYLADETDPIINMNLDINQFNMKALEGFSNGQVSNASGNFLGNFKLNGQLSSPNYTGQLIFDNANFKIAQLNENFILDNDILNIDNNGLTMNNFTIQDEKKNTFALSGTIGTENFLNPTFNLDIKADNFQIINASKEDNKLVYGNASFDAEGTLTGNLEIPKLDATLKVSPDTDITYVLPNAAVNLEQRDGVVIFVNRENPDAILTRTEETIATLTGFDINANLKIGNAAKVKIIIDEETKDNFQISGDGNFNFKMNPNGLLNLTGKYDIVSGHYEMNLYNLVNRRFELKSGGSISWYGDPFDAKLDVSAIYKLEASASPLMASQVSGADPSVKNKFQQVLPFYVYLNIEGELMQPIISFNLDMPEEEQGAIGGQVYGRIQQVNQQENVLNQQVFSLLVLNRFYPDSDSDGSYGGFTTIARDNLNDALSDQLNVFSNRLLGDTGVELDFGLDSYTDYQGDTPQDRTQLDIAAKKKLFNDRLIVSVGSEVDIQGTSQDNEPTPLIGNVSLEYLLTENGRYRLKGFRKNEFENVIDGQTIVSGIALIFTQEFNKFDELWTAILKGGKQKNKDSKEKDKNEK